MAERTSDEVAAIFSAAGDSVTVIGIARDTDTETDAEYKDKIKRNVDHLELIKAYKKEDDTTSIWTTESFTAIDAISNGTSSALISWSNSSSSWNTTLSFNRTWSGTLSSISNGLTDGTVTVTGYEICSLAGGAHVPVPTMAKHIIYSHDHSGGGNTWVMPNAINGNVYYIKKRKNDGL